MKPFSQFIFLWLGVILFFLCATAAIVGVYALGVFLSSLIGKMGWYIVGFLVMTLVVTWAIYPKDSVRL